MSDNDDYMDDEAQREDDFNDSSEEEEDEDNYEKDDFLVDDYDDDLDDDEEIRPVRDYDDGRKKKKKKKKRYREDSPELAEGDLQLLEERGVRVERKKLKRLRKGASDEEDNPDMDGLGDDDDDAQFEERRRRVDEPVDYDDDMDDFIDDGGRQRRRRAAEREGLVSSEAVRQARSIFGDVDEITKYKGLTKLFKKGEGQDADEGDDADFKPEEEVDDKPLRIIRDRDSDMSDQEDDLPTTQMPQEGEQLADHLSGPPPDDTEAKRIVRVDIPEQLQYHFGKNHKTPSDPQLKDEGDWVYSRGFQNNPNFQDHDRFPPDAVKKKILVVLSYIHIDKLDIPFIAMYRKDYITPYMVPPAGERLRDVHCDDPSRDTTPMFPPRGFNSFKFEDYAPGLSFEHFRGVPRGYDDGFGNWTVLWHILDLDKRYHDMLKKRQELLDLAKSGIDKGLPNMIVDEITTQMKDCDDERTLKDVERYLHLQIDLAEVLSSGDIASEFMDDKDDMKGKRPSRRKNRYLEFCRREIRPLSAEFGLTARQFGENVRGEGEYNMQMHVPMDADDHPAEVARVYANRSRSSFGGVPPEKLSERMLSAARYITVTEFLVEGRVLQTARMFLRKPGSVSITTTPTRLGISQVDDSHALRCVTNLAEKKLETFASTVDFALVQKAVSLGFTKMKVVFQQEQLNALETLLTSAFVVSGVTSSMVQQWNEQRSLIIKEVFAGLIAQMREEIIEDLEFETSIILRNRLMDASSRRLLLGPGRPSPNPLDNGYPRVLACCVTHEDDEEHDPVQTAKDFEDSKSKGQALSDRRVAHERITVVELDENGEYQTGYEMFAQWLRRPFRVKLPNTVKDQLKAFIIASRANIITIGVGSGGQSAVRLRRDLIETIADIICGEDYEELSRPPLNLSNTVVRQVREVVKKEKNEEKNGDMKAAQLARMELWRVLGAYVVLADDFPARIYARTKGAMIGLSVDAMTLLEKRAIGLGRLAQEPLWVYCAIEQEENIALHLKFHEHHYVAKPADRRVAFRRALTRAVCVQGVDINRLLRFPHMQSMLFYVGGLGNHKGKALLDMMGLALNEEINGLTSRKQLWTDSYVGRVVFISTAAYLRVRDPELHSGGSSRRAVEFRRSKTAKRSRRGRRDDDFSDLYDPMDDSRVHPEHYAVAIKIADESLRDEDSKYRINLTGDPAEDALLMASSVLDDSSGLQRLALDEYAAHLDRIGRGRLFETIKLIASEFQGPFKDYRIALQSPPPQGLFYMVSKCDPLAMRIGSLLTATECRIRERRNGGSIIGIGCSLPYGVRGFIPMRNFSDRDLSDEDVRKIVPEGSSLNCRITEFNYDRFEVVLTSKPSRLKDPFMIDGYIPIVNTSDPSYRPYPKLSARDEPHSARLLNTDKEDRANSKANPRLKRTMVSLRNHAKPIVSHPLFREIPGQDAIAQLRDMLPGDVIIRPSQYDKKGIIFSCKFASGLQRSESGNNSDGVFHKDCQMEYDPSNEAFPLRLTLDDSVFEHVDQILEQHLRPIITNLVESLEHRKFVPGSEREIEKVVSDIKRNRPKEIPYRFGLSERSSTSLVLVYIPGRKSIEKEEIKVLPNGYRLRSVMHKNMNVLFDWFKKNMRNRSTTRRGSAAPVQASPFHSYNPAPSPFHRPAASPFHGARSPYSAPKSPFATPKSPFHGGIQAAARPVEDIPPPPAPLSLSAPSPFNGIREEVPGARAQVNGSNGRAPGSDNDWSKATLTRDDPPPRSDVHGSYGRNDVGHGPPQRRPSPPRHRGDGMRGMNRGSDLGPPRDRNQWGARGRSPPQREPGWRGPPPQRGPPPNQRGPPQRGPPPRGPPPRGPPGRGDMPSWRGSKPVPAWQKQAEEAARQQAQ